MLEEMEAYAQKCLKIQTLERKVKFLEDKLRSEFMGTVSKEEIKSWLTIGLDYCFLSDFGKAEAIKMFGEQ